MIRSRTGEDVAIALDHAIQRHLESTKAQIHQFRASVVYPFADDDFSWPVLEWTEGEDTEVLAIYEIDLKSEGERCSWLMHYGFGRSIQSEGQPWKKAMISWNATNMGDLKTLFRVSQHLLGILEWPNTDIFQLYCQEGDGNCSNEEYAPIFTTWADRTK